MSNPTTTTIPYLRRVDAAVAEHVLNWKVGRQSTLGGVDAILVEPDGEILCRGGRTFRPTESVADAWLVVEKMRQADLAFVMNADRAGASLPDEDCEVQFVDQLATGRSSIAYGPAPLAICLAALAALGAEVAGE